MPWTKIMLGMGEGSRSTPASDENAVTVTPYQPPYSNNSQMNTCKFVMPNMPLIPLFSWRCYYTSLQPTTNSATGIMRARLEGPRRLQELLDSCYLWRQSCFLFLSSLDEVIPSLCTLQCQRDSERGFWGSEEASWASR